MKLHISHYSKRGYGLGKINSHKIEVAGTVIGDTICIDCGKRKRGRCANLVKVLAPSPDRVMPRCMHSGTCGGCAWQQKSYAAQLVTKQNFLQSLFSSTHLPLIPCVDPWHYRNKMEFSFSQDKKGNRFLGLIIAGSRGRVLNLKECYLTPPWFISIVKTLYSWWGKSGLLAYHPYSDRGSLRTLTLRDGKRTGEKMVYLTISGNSKYFINRDQINTFKEAVNRTLLNEDPSIFLRIHRICKGKPSAYYEMHLSGPEWIKEILYVHGRKLLFHISPSSFFQTNTLQAEKLYTQTLALTNPKPTDTLLDLYCGMATLGIVFSPYVRKVIGIEVCVHAVCDAKMNIKMNKLSNITICHGDVGMLLAQYVSPPDLCIVNPPRSGLDESVLKHLMRLTPKKILYISCNPKTQSENISVFLQNGYILKYVQGVDQFPHTPHIENIAILIKP